MFTVPMPQAPAPIVVDITQDEILTGEAVALDVQPIGFFLRALGVLHRRRRRRRAAHLLRARLVVAASARTSSTRRSSRSSPSRGLVLVTVVLPTVGRDGVPRPQSRQARRRRAHRARRRRGVRLPPGLHPRARRRVRDLVHRGRRRRDRRRLHARARSGSATSWPAPTPSARAPPHCRPPPPACRRRCSAWATVADVARLPDRLARRIAQFVSHADSLEPSARARVAASLAVRGAGVRLARARRRPRDVPARRRRRAARPRAARAGPRGSARRSAHVGGDAAHRGAFPIR